MIVFRCDKCNEIAPPGVDVRRYVKVTVHDGTVEQPIREFSGSDDVGVDLCPECLMALLGAIEDKLP